MVSHCKVKAWLSTATTHSLGQCQASHLQKHPSHLYFVCFAVAGRSATNVKRLYEPIHQSHFCLAAFFPTLARLVFQCSVGFQILSMFFTHNMLLSITRWQIFSVDFWFSVRIYVLRWVGSILLWKYFKNFFRKTHLKFRNWFTLVHLSLHFDLKKNTVEPILFSLLATRINYNLITKLRSSSQPPTYIL